VTDELSADKEGIPRDRPHWKREARRYQRFLAQGNWSGETWVQYGYASKQAGDLRTAAHAYAMALAMQANSLSDAHLLTAALHEVQGDKQRALLSYKYALKFNPQNTSAATELRALGVSDDEVASIVEGGEEDRRHIGLHPADSVFAAKSGFPKRNRKWRRVLAAVIVLVLLCGAALLLVDPPEFAQGVYRSTVEEAQRLTGWENAGAEARNAAETQVRFEAAARKTAEQKALTEAAARRAAEEKAQIEATARKTAEETARTEAAARKAAEDKLMVETTAREAAEQKISVEIAAREAAENARRKLEDTARKAVVLQEQTTLAKRPDETTIDSHQQPEKAEAGLNLSEQDRKRVQVELNSLGHEMPTATGYFGPRTRAMIKAWQKEQSLPETGYLDANQLTVLHDQANQTKRPNETKLDARQQAEKAEAGLNLSEQDRKRVQVALNSLGHEFPTVTGYFGPRTRAMIAAWQKVQGLPETGFLTADQLATLLQQAAPALAKYDQAQASPKPKLSP
jgi:peptidoglycan hydrolase-like protein with peptidoglycan-binding domain